MKKVLFVANTDRHINLCHIPYLKLFHDKGYKVYVATNSSDKLDYCDVKINISLDRKPFKIKNIIAIRELKKIINKENFDLIHVHTPTGSVVGRIAAIKVKKKGTRVIYTAHGFHFFKGCPKINYILYYPIEKILSRYTDLIITMNKEDYIFAKNHFIKTEIEYIPGIGFNIDKFDKVSTKKEIDELKKEINVKEEFIITYVAEISKRKRQEYLIKVLSKMNLNNIKILLVGENTNDKKVRYLINKYNLIDKVLILGFRNDINTILDITDLVVSVSSQEGLPLNIMEALYKNKCVLATKERGVLDLIHDGNGILIGKYDKVAFMEAIYLLKSNSKYRKEISNSKKDIEKYSIKNVIKIMEGIYTNILKK